MEKLADISKFQNLINESNRTLVENGAKWNMVKRAAKKAALPWFASLIVRGVPAYLYPNEVYAPETIVEAPVSEEQKLSETYTGEISYPEVVDKNLQRKILEYNKPVN